MLAVITGSGFYEVPGLADAETRAVPTPFGDAEITSGTWHGGDVLFLPRHGPTHAVPPHRINYRANLWALQQAGATGVLATAVSGGIARDLQPGDLVLVDQFVESTRGRADTFFDGDGGPVRHTDMTEPYDRTLRTLLADAAARLDVVVRPTGTYACTNGPRFETPAEIAVLGRLGADLVGMTGYPEVALAAELGLPYASIGIISNFAAGLAEAVTLEEIVEVLEAVRPVIWALIGEVARTWNQAS